MGLHCNPMVATWKPSTKNLVQDAMMATGIFVHLAQLLVSKLMKNYICIYFFEALHSDRFDRNQFKPEIRLILNSSIGIRSIDHDTDQFTSV